MLERSTLVNGNGTKQKHFFKPTSKYYETQEEYDKAHEEFFEGDISEEFIQYCAHEAFHAFWFNYKGKERKIGKEKFREKIKELVNQMLKEC